MALENLAAKGAGVYDVRSSHGLGGDVKGFSRTLELSNAANIGSTYDFGYIPSNARLFGSSKVFFDAVGGAGILLDIGLAGVDGNITTSLQALNDSIAASTAGSGALIKDIANYGKRAWEYVSGVTADPQGMFILRVSTRGAAGTGGTITMELLFTIP